jgi:hypothetical protein
MQSLYAESHLARVDAAYKLFAVILMEWGISMMKIPSLPSVGEWQTGLC